MSMELILQLLQTASVVLAVVVAMGTIRGRDNDRASTITKMQVDIEYLKRQIDGFDKQMEKISEQEACCKTISKRLVDHLCLDQGCKKEGERE